MAFKDLSSQVAEEFEGAQQQEARLQEALEYQRRTAGEKDRARFRANHANRAFALRAERAASNYKIQCACCRAPCITPHQLATHYANAHPPLNAAYKLRLAALEADERRRSQLLKDLHAASRQLAASRDLTLALEERVALLTARLRGI